MVNVLDLIFLITQLVLLIIFSFQIKANGRTANYLVYGMIVGIIATTFSILSQIIDLQGFSRTFLSLQLMAYGAEYILVYLHFQGTITDQLGFIQPFSISFIYGIHSAYGIYYAIFGIDGYPEMIWDISYNLLGVVCFGFVVYSLILAFKHTREISAMIQIMAAVLLWLGFFSSIFTTPILASWSGLGLNREITDGVKAVGILLLIVVYIYNPDYIERLPVQTFGIMAFDKGGNTLSYHQISSRGIFEDVSLESRSMLMTSLTRAILSFIREALGSNTDLDRIETADKLILFDIGEEIGVAVIAERGTKILQQSILRCQQQLDKLVGSDINRGQINTTKIRSVISEAFPYIVFI